LIINDSINKGYAKTEIIWYGREFVFSKSGNCNSAKINKNKSGNCTSIFLLVIFYCHEWN